MKAIALISGGLDSTLATHMMRDQGVELIALNFKTPFCLCDGKASSGCGSHAKRVADGLGIPLEVVNVTEEFLEVIRSPRHGYGSNMNPCIDCRVLKFRKAKEFMQKTGASFIVTGEVLGQRPMSQHRQALHIIDRESELEGLVLRPLSAKLFPETIPEKMGWVSREKLLDLSGRSRKPQIELAERLHIKDYPCPAGGCLLTDPEFSKKVKDLIGHQELNLHNVQLLKIGRHFRFSKAAKLIIGRNERENNSLLQLALEQDYLFMPGDDMAGPTSLGRGNFSEELITLSCRITCHYCDRDSSTDVAIRYRKVFEKEDRVVKVAPLDDAGFTSFRIT